MIVLRKSKMFSKSKQPQGKTPTYTDLEKANNRTSEENKKVIETSNNQIEIAASSRIESQRNKHIRHL